MRLMLLALLTFSIGVIWFLIEFSEVLRICSYDVTAGGLQQEPGPSLLPSLLLLYSF